MDIDSSTNAAQTKAGVATTGRNDKSSDAHLSLFHETFQALDAGEVIGLFPEGTSYTEPEIAQVKDGAAWVALEYARWRSKREDKDDQAEPSKSRKLVVIPVGIVYSDKARYQSRVRGLRLNNVDYTWLTSRFMSGTG